MGRKNIPMREKYTRVKIGYTRVKIRLSQVVKTGVNKVVLHPMNSIVNNVVEPSILLQLSRQVATVLKVQQHCLNKLQQY